MPLLLIDTRQQKDKHILKDEFFAAKKILTYRTKLVVGDYKWSNGHASVDTKADIYELASNLQQQHDRFRRELSLAQDCEIPLTILVENKDGILSLNDFANWTEPEMHFNFRRLQHRNAKRVDGAILAKTIASMQRRYGTRFEFCRPEDAGRDVLYYLDVMEHGYI